MDLHSKLVSVAAEYDRKESTKRGYNIYALAHYMEAIQSVDACLAKLLFSANPQDDVRRVLCGHFTGRLLDQMLKAAGLPKSSVGERRSGRWERQTEF